jgi:hypothetical protein
MKNESILTTVGKKPVALENRSWYDGSRCITTTTTTATVVVVVDDDDR